MGGFSVEMVLPRPAALVAWGSSAPITTAGETQAARTARSSDSRFDGQFIFLSGSLYRKRMNRPAEILLLRRRREFILHHFDDDTLDLDLRQIDLPVMGQALQCAEFDIQPLKSGRERLAFLLG
jgi:hypothetical protein